MRYSNKPTTAAGTIRVTAFGLRQTVILIVLGLVLLWAIVAFAQEAYISHRLGQQVTDLRKQNADIAAQNAGYRKDVAALERFAETVFNVYIDVAIELLVARAPAEGLEIKKLKAEPILSELRRARVLDADLWQRLDDVREGRNTLLQHGSSFAPIAAVWLTIEQTNRSIDKAIETIQRAFGELGIRLDVEFS